MFQMKLSNPACWIIAVAVREQLRAFSYSLNVPNGTNHAKFPEVPP